MINAAPLVNYWQRTTYIACLNADICGDSNCLAAPAFCVRSFLLLWSIRASASGASVTATEPITTTIAATIVSAKRAYISYHIHTSNIIAVFFCLLFLLNGLRTKLFYINTNRSHHLQYLWFWSKRIV